MLMKNKDEQLVDFTYNLYCTLQNPFIAVVWLDYQKEKEKTP